MGGTVMDYTVVKMYRIPLLILFSGPACRVSCFPSGVLLVLFINSNASMYSLVGGHCFPHYLTIVNKAVVSNHVHVFGQTYLSVNSFVYTNT